MGTTMCFRSLQVVGPTRVVIEFETDDGEIRRFHFTATQHTMPDGRTTTGINSESDESFGVDYTTVPVNGWPDTLDARAIWRLVGTAVEVAKAEFPIDGRLDAVRAERAAEVKRRWDENAPSRQAQARRLEGQ
jgi:hypothetical protein